MSSAITVAYGSISDSGTVIVSSPNGSALNSSSMIAQRVVYGSAVPEAKAATQAGELVTVETDDLVAVIDSIGGELRRVVLRKYRDAVDPAKNLVLFDQGGERIYVAQSGLIGKDLPNHRTPYSVQPGERSTGPGRDTVEVRLLASTAAGVQVAKTFRFRQGSYEVGS